MMPYVSVPQTASCLREFQPPERRPPRRNAFPWPGVVPAHPKEVTMKGIIAWLLGVPLVVVILLYVFHIF